MATFLSKLFKPKWQNKHLPTRLEAIKALDNNSAEDQEILISIAQEDSHIDARSEAIKKLNQSDKLIELHKKAATDTQVVIEQRLYELADAQSLTIFDLIVDPKLLTEMIIKSDRPDVFIRGLAHVEDQQALLTIAQSSKTSKIRQAAAELIESEESLQELIQTAKSKDKSVFQIAKNKLAKIKEEAKAKQDQQHAIESLITAIQDHAKTDNTKLYEAKLSSLVQRWTEQAVEASTEQQTRFKNAEQACRNKFQALIEGQQKEAEEARLIQAGGDEQDATLLTLQDTLERFRDTPASAQDMSGIDAVIKTQETRWLEATKLGRVEKAKAKHYQVLMTELRQYLNALKQLNESSAAIIEVIENVNSSKDDARSLNEGIRQLRDLKDGVNWPSGYAKPELLTKADDALGHSANVKEQLAKDSKEIQNKINQLIKDLDKALEERLIKKSAKLHKDIQSMLSRLGAQQGASFHNQLTLRQKQLQDLRDWQGYASAPRQQELCEQMERLAEQHIDPAEKADRIKTMQNEWKQLGGANDQDLWVRFKTASDKTYEPCKEYFGEQKALKTANLERRKVLVTQLAEFVEQTNWDSADWKVCDQINRKARLDWRDAYPVDFKSNKPIQTQFNELLSKLDNILDVERNKNLEAKQGVVEKAQAFAEQLNKNEIKLDEAIQGAKLLQQDWKKIGITDHKKDRKLWKDFRKACDQIFEQRDSEREARREEVSTAIKQFDELCNHMDNFVAEITDKDSADKTSDDLNNALADFRKQFKQLPAIPAKQSEKLINRYEQAIKSINNAVKAIENQRIIAEWQEMKRRSTICRALFNAFSESQPVDDIEARNEQFNTGIGLYKQLENNLKSLWISVKANSVAKEYLIDQAEARNLCIRCEIASGVDSPDSDKELRMQLQVSRLSEGMSSSIENQSRESQLRELLEQWYLKVGIPVSEFEGFEQRIEAAVTHLFGKAN